MFEWDKLRLITIYPIKEVVMNWKKAGRVILYVIYGCLWFYVKSVETFLSIFDLYDDHGDRVIGSRYHGDREAARLNGDFWA